MPRPLTFMKFYQGMSVFGTHQGIIGHSQSYVTKGLHAVVDRQRIASLNTTQVKGDERVRSNLARPGSRYTLDVDGVQVAYKLWQASEPSLEPHPTIVLLHGNAARLEWWDAIAPELTQTGNVIAVDFTGHGESQWKDEYDFEDWSNEVLAVLERENVLDEVFLVGHSMGGLVSLMLGWHKPDQVKGIILLDTPFRRYTEEQLQKRIAIAARPLPTYGSLREAIDKFKTTPALVQRQEDLWYHIAESSYRQGADGWSLHFDPKLFARITDVERFRRRFPKNTYLLRADQGLVSAPVLEEMLPCLGGRDHLIELADAGHNVLLEDPLSTAEHIQTVLANIVENK